MWDLPLELMMETFVRLPLKRFIWNIRCVSKIFDDDALVLMYLYRYNKYHLTILFSEACKHGDEKLVRLLIRINPQNIDVNAYYSLGLRWVAHENHYSIVQELLQDDRFVWSADNGMCLWLSAVRGHIETLGLIIRTSCYNIFKEDLLFDDNSAVCDVDNYMDALKTAFQRNHLQCVKILLTNPSIKIKHDDGDVPIFITLTFPLTNNDVCEKIISMRSNLGVWMVDNL